MRDEYKDLNTRARYAWLCACYLGVWNFRETFETRRYMLCRADISGIVACGQFYRIGGSTYVGAGIGATLYGPLIV